MRVAVISDIHGNKIALDAVLEDLSRQPPVDYVVVAGDLCLNGPCPLHVLKTVRSLNCPVIQGNVDWEVAQNTPHSGEKKRNTVAWTREQIGPEGIHFLDTLPFSHLVSNPEGTDLLIVHANPKDLEEAIFPNMTDDSLERLLSDMPQTVGALAFGHLHIPYTRRWRHLLLADIASCGLPRDEDQRAAYGIVRWENDTWEAEIRRVPYDLKETIRQLKHSGIPNVEKRIKVLIEAKY